MTNTIAYDSERASAEASLRKHSGIFTSRGFVYRGLEVQHSKLLPDYNLFTFVNPATGRTIEISHVPSFDSRGRTFVFTIGDGSGKSFALATYLRAHGRDDLVRTLENASNIPDFDAALEEVIRTLQHIVDGDPHLAEIIDGKTWEDVPFDWMGYK
jgi:hypothetical protein